LRIVSKRRGTKGKEKPQPEIHLTALDRMLITVRDELYEGSWEQLEADLRARLEGRPYIYKLATRIKDDLMRIQKLRGYEEEYDINLSTLI
jgi:hypothetical protein